MSQAILDAYTKEVRSCLSRAVRQFGCTFDPADVEIYYNIRGQVAGRARILNHRYILQFNPEAVINYNEDMTDNTIPHEVAHIVCFNQPNLGEGHDAGWKRVCRMLGGDDSRTHDYVLTLAKIKPINRYYYRLANGEEVPVGPKHHKGLQNGKYPYLTSKDTGAVIRASDWTGRVKDHQTRTAAQQPTPIPGINIVKSDVPNLNGAASKKDKAAAIFKANATLSRAQVIDLFVQYAGLTKAGAGTYYQNFKSGKF